MAGPIYKVWFMKYKEAWYQLTPQEQNKLMEKNQELMKQDGGEVVVYQTCLWSSEEWLGWGVEKYPSIEAEQQHTLNLYNIQWFRYVESKTYLGVDMPTG